MKTRKGPVLTTLCSLLSGILITACAGPVPLTQNTPTPGPGSVVPPPTLIIAPTATLSPTPTQPPPPEITLSPASGGAGTQVTVTGTGFPANARLNLHLGQPGIGAGSQSHLRGVTGAKGTMTMTFVMPEAWPDSTPILEEKLVILVAAGDSGPEATAEFIYTLPESPANYPETPEEVLDRFLKSLMDDYDGEGRLKGISSLGYLARDLRTEVRNGRSLLQILGIQDVYRSFRLDVPGSEVGETVTFQATLNFSPSQQVRLFVLNREDEKQNGRWRINAVAATVAEDTSLSAEPGDPKQVVHNFLFSLLRDQSGDSSLPYLSHSLATEVQAGRSIFSILGVQGAYETFSYELIRPNSGGVAKIRVTLNYESGSQVRIFALIQEGDGWHINAISVASR